MAIVDNLSRVHEVVPQAGGIVFVDATSNLGSSHFSFSSGFDFKHSCFGR